MLSSRTTQKHKMPHAAITFLYFPEDKTSGAARNYPDPIVREDVLAFNAGGNDVMKSPWSVYARLARHKALIPEIYEAVVL